MGDNDGQATHGARKHVWRTQAVWAKKNNVDEKSVTKNHFWYWRLAQAQTQNISPKEALGKALN